MQPIVLAYVPPPTYGHPRAFLQNLTRYRTRFPVLLFSDARPELWDGLKMPEVLSIPSPEMAREGGEAWAVNNLCWLTAMRLAMKRGFSHVIYLEEDVRVGCDDWDGIMFDEYKRVAPPTAIAGSVVCFSPFAYGLKAAAKWNELLQRNWKRNVPIPSYGAKGAADRMQPKVFVNGALGIYPVLTIGGLFDLNQKTVQQAKEITAWDHEIGTRLWKRYEENAFDHVYHLESVFSSYANVLTTPEERMQMLSPEGLDIGDGRRIRVVAVHQIKSPWDGPTTHTGAVPVTNADGGNQTQLQQDTALEHLEVTGIAGKSEAGVTVAEAESQPGTELSRTPGSEPVAESPSAAPVTSIPLPQPSTSLDGTRVDSGAAAETGSDVAGVVLRLPTQQSGNRVDVQPVESLPASNAPVSAPLPLPRMDIFIVTFKRDVWWLRQCLASIAKFTTGFGATHVAYPKQDTGAFQQLRVDFGDVQWHEYLEAAAPLGHLDHNVRKCTADLFCMDADLICHVDADCFFREPTGPGDYIMDGKPVLLIESFEHLKTAHQGRYHWKEGVDRALKIDAKFETMCRHPAVHWRSLYPAMRDRIEEVHGKSFEEYVLSQRSERPCGFAEFPTLGAYALVSKRFRNVYHFVDVQKEPRPHDHLVQFWSHNNPDGEQRIWIEGEMHKIVPSQFISKALA
jgi:hypothetical protein